mgnify:CR=1 FL=1|tara:strand:+ start:79 stop:1125 length:1047 start_codon:yes stop_codon:yes gene_type:complete
MSSFFLNKVKFLNKFTVSPMCQYSSLNGCPSEWHYHHLRNLIETGVGSMVVESTAVSKVGRITKKDLCLYNKKHLYSHKKLIKYLKKLRKIPIILQISHSGRKGSAEIPWIKKNKSLNKFHSWKTWAPSSIQRSKKWPKPKEMTKKDIEKVIDQFTHTAKLAFKAGYDGVEIHMAHGYLIHEFCSPVSNKRKDEYGIKGNNFKFQREVLRSIKKILPKNKIIGARVTGSDHLPQGIKVADCINLIQKLKQDGLDYVCISSGGIIPKTNMKFNKGFRLKMAKKIKEECKIFTRTSGCINDQKTLSLALKKYKLDSLALGRILIRDKYFLLKNKKLKLENELKQYNYCFN